MPPSPPPPLPVAEASAPASAANIGPGFDCVAVALVPIGIPNVEEAIDRAIEAAGGDYDALGDGVLYLDIYAFIFGKECVRVSGTPVKTREILSGQAPGPGRLWRHSRLATPEPGGPG